MMTNNRLSKKRGDFLKSPLFYKLLCFDYSSGIKVAITLSPVRYFLATS